MNDVILDQYAQGALLVGVSAGAVQLGRYGIVETPDTEETELLDVFDLVPLVIDAHDERAGWTRLARAIQTLKGSVTGLGIPSGGGVIVHTDGAIETLRRPAHRLTFDSPRGVHSELIPPITG
jgi:cyanophycinase-like exopeptidase